MKNGGPFNQAQLIKAIMKGGCAEDIAEESGWHDETVRRYLRMFHTQGLIYIERWQVNGRFRKAIWSWKSTGYEEDAPRPRRMNDKERNKRWFAKKVREAAEQMIAGRL